MEPESHRLDREALLADRVVVAERVQRDVDDLVDSATEKRRAFFDQFVDRVRTEADLRRRRDRIARAAQPVLASATAGDPEQAATPTAEARSDSSES